MDNSSKRRGRKVKKVGGGKRTTVNAPRGPIREKTGGVGVTLCAVSKRPNDKKQQDGQTDKWMDGQTNGISPILQPKNCI